jgi:hypothetical protein
MRYEIMVNPPTEATNLLLDYRNTSGALFSIATYDAFDLQIPELVGSGYLRVTVNGQPLVASLPEVITQPGLLHYPFNYMTIHSYESPIESVQFYFYPLTSNFSMGLDEIALVPEPCGALLLLSGAGILAMRRRRV